MLTVKGKVVNDLVVVGDEGALWLWIPADAMDAAHTRLDRHVIMDDVSLDRRDDMEAVLVLDPEWTPPASADPGALIVRSASYPATGVWIQGETGAVAQALHGLEELSYDAWTRARVAAGIPAWSNEIVSDVFPPEVGFVDGVSYDKGCFMGQEPLARIHARGQVNRVMVRVEVHTDGARLESLPATLCHETRQDAGRLTTVAPALAGETTCTGLAVVRRAFASNGATLTTEAGAGVTVRSGPLGDDHGVDGRRHG
jgi:folate-binding protein YgfZ